MSQGNIFHRYSCKQGEFLNFVLDHYVNLGVGELDQDKLPDLLELKYHSIPDAVAEMGSVADIRNVFIGFQQHLYAPQSAA
jgi:type I restriction enzyme R subunit